MAKFNPSEAVLADNQQSKFNPSEAILADSPHQNWLMKTADVVNDAGKGTDASLINTLSTLTGGLTPRYDPTGNKTAINVGKIAGSLLPGGVAEKGAALGLSGLERLPAIAKTALASSAGGAAGSLGVDANPLEGAAIGGGIGSALHIAPNVWPAIKSGARRLLVGNGKNVTPEEFKAARDAVPDGIAAPIGELAKSPRAERLYGLAKGAAFSGADKPYQQLYDHLTQGTGELTEAAPNAEGLNDDVYKELSNKYETAKQGTRDAYQDLADYSDENSVPFDRTALDKKIDDSLSEIKKANKNETTAEHYANAIKTLKDYKKTPLSSFSDAVSVRPVLGKLIRNSSISKDDAEARRYLQKIKSGIDESLEQSALKSDNPDILNLHNQAKEARKYQGTFENLNKKDETPFFKIYDKGGDSGKLLSQYLKPSRANTLNDNAGILSSLTDKLEPETTEKIAAGYINPDGQQTLANKLGRLKNLSKNQRATLFGDNAPTADNINQLSNIYSKSKSANFTPETGYTGSKEKQAAEIAKELLKQAGRYKTLVAGGAIGTPVAGIPGAIAGAAAWPALMQASQRALRSEWLKNEYARHLAGIARRPQAPNPILNNLVRQPAIATQGGNNG